MKLRPIAMLLALLVPSVFGEVASVSVSGFVGNILGQRLPGASVRLVRAGLSTTSDDMGQWSVAGQVDVGVLPRSSKPKTLDRHLVVQGGRLVLQYDGMTALGRKWTSAEGANFAPSGPLARAMADSFAVDTIYYSWKGSLVDKKPLMAWQRTGLKEYIDTTSVVATVTPGPSGVVPTNPIVLADYAKYTAGMVKIPARNRSFLMGLKDSTDMFDFTSYPQHKVSFSYDWYMDTTRVTAREFGRVMTWAVAQGYAEVQTDNTGARGIYTLKDSIRLVATLIPLFGSSSTRYLGWNEKARQFEAPWAQDYPMVDATWFGALLYANMKSLMAGLEPVYETKTWTINYAKNGYRRPTESEWEYSARGGTTSTYFWGESMDHVSKFAITSGHWGVGATLGNPYGLYDMVGNGEDWCNDLGGLPLRTAVVDPIGPSPNGTIYDNTRVSRGADLRSGARMYSDPSSSTGLRLVLPLH